MEDIVLDTNAYRLLLNERYVDRIIEVNDEIFVSKKGWGTESKGVPELQAGYNIITASVRKLSKRNKFHERSGGSTMLPTPLKNVLEGNGGDEFDVDVACVAYGRKSSGHGIYIISNDYHFERAKPHFEGHQINIERRDEELNRVGL